MNANRTPDGRIATAAAYQPSIGDTVWIAKTNHHISGTVTEVSPHVCYLTDDRGEEHYAVLGHVYASEADALRELISDVNLTLRMAHLRLSDLDAQAALIKAAGSQTQAAA